MQTCNVIQVRAVTNLSSASLKNKGQRFMAYQVLNPTSETEPAETVIVQRPASLAGKTVGIISNGKEGTKGFFTHLQRMLYDEMKVDKVVFCTKSNYSAPAETDIIREAGNWDMAITGIGD